MSRVTGDVAAIEGFVLSGVVEALSAAVRLAVFDGPVPAVVAADARGLVVAPLFWLASGTSPG